MIQDFTFNIYFFNIALNFELHLLEWFDSVNVW